jgi:hypothetical protein
MQAFLATIEKRMERMKQAEGPISDFTGYVTRICRILDIHYLIEKRADSGDSWSEYDRGDYRYTSLRTDGRFSAPECTWRVQDMVRKLWTDADRTAAKSYQERKEEERREREAVQA